MPFVNLLLYLANSFQFRLVIAELMFCVGMKTRRLIHPVLIFGLTGILSFPVVIDLVDVSSFYGNPLTEIYGFNASFLLVFFLSLLMITLCFKCTFPELLFLGAGAFIMQNLIYDVAGVIRLLFFSDINSYMSYGSLDIFSVNEQELSYNIICVLILAIGLALCYWIFVRKWNEDHQIYVQGSRMLRFLFTTIILLNIISSLATSPNNESVYIYLLLAVCSVLLMITQFNIFDLSRRKYELEMEEYQWHVAKKQQQMSQNAADLINIKAHDLKRNLEAISAGLSAKSAREELAEAEKAIHEYDSGFRTGNAALDTILTEKNAICEMNHVDFSVIADGSLLDFVRPIDIFLLLGNILDNAIERMQHEPEDNRIISMQITQKEGHVLLNVENTCSDSLTFDSAGIPQTIKEDTNYHGFGIKSIQSIVGKYQGNMVMRLENQIFRTTIMFHPQILKPDQVPAKNQDKPR